MLIPADVQPVAVCTSSATVGPSLSLGRADAAVVIAKSGAVADAVASALGNRVHSGEDVQRAIEAVKHLDGVLGLAVVADGVREACAAPFSVTRIADAPEAPGHLPPPAPKRGSPDR